MTERSSLVAQYRQGAANLMAAVKAVPEAAISWKPEPTEWSVAEVLWHCAECESVFHTRIRTLWIGPTRTLVSFDQDDWAGTPGYEGLPVQTAIDVIRSTRSMTTMMLEQLPDAAWNIEGMHTENGLVTLEAVVAHAAKHLDIHVEQVRNNVRAWQARQDQDANVPAS